MKNSVKTALAIGLVTTLGAGGAALMANAEGNSPTSTRIAQSADSETNEGPENGVENEANEGPENGSEDANEAQEMAQYQSLAKITPEQAQQTAEADQSSTATKVKLDEEDGSLVYKVEFTNAEVLVDAGDGKILKTELEGQEENDTTEAPVQGSIQVPEGADGQEETQQ